MPVFYITQALSLYVYTIISIKDFIYCKVLLLVYGYKAGCFCKQNIFCLMSHFSLKMFFLHLGPVS